MKIKQILFTFTLFDYVGYIISSLMYPPFFNDQDLITLRKVKNLFRRNELSTPAASNISQLPPCDEDTLMMNLAEIQIINPESILKMASVDEMANICEKVEMNLKKSTEYLQTCTPQNQKDLYFQLIKGVETLYKKLCEDSGFRDKFNKYHKCYKDIVREYDDCSGPADWNEDSEPKKICAAYKEIVDCYYIKTAEACGIEAAKLMKELIIAVVNSIITVKCDLVYENPTVRDALPDDAAKKLDELKVEGESQSEEPHSAGKLHSAGQPYSAGKPYFGGKSHVYPLNKQSSNLRSQAAAKSYCSSAPYHIYLSFLEVLLINTIFIVS